MGTKKGTKWYTKDKTETKLCKCGCETTILKWQVNLKERFYAFNHQPRSKPQSFIEYRRKDWIENNPIKKTSLEHPGKRTYPRICEKIRATLMKEVGKCQICKSKKTLNIHHKDGNPYNNTRDNIILLCRSCHSKEHLS